MMANKTIDALHRGKKGKVSDKWASYLGYHDRIFSPLRKSPISLLEIGIQNGGSLETWLDYFQVAEKLVGCDINPKCKNLEYADPRINVVVGDANTTASFQEIQAISPAFDIIIDDGSHISNDVLVSFINYFPLLKPGGIYIVEDSHTLYMDGFGGGLLNDSGAYGFFKKLIDVVNYQFWADSVTLGAYFRTWFPLDATPSFISEGWIDSIEFRNSIITIRKSTENGHNKLGERLIVGNEAIVQNFQ